MFLKWSVARTSSGEHRWRSRAWLTGCLVVGTFACGGVADDSKLPPNVPDPATLHTTNGALARYRSTLAAVPRVFDSLVALTGILTDELAGLPAPIGFRGRYTTLDSRQSLNDFGRVYSQLHYLRGQAREARGFLMAYAPTLSPALAGHLYAVEGYAEVFLADIFCSGIPLSTVDFDGDYTTVGGSSTTAVYGHAIALFDSALAMISTDSVPLQYLAAIGRGRSLLALGRYADAATAVAGVPDDYRHQVVFTPRSSMTSEGVILDATGILQSLGSGSTSEMAGGYAKLPNTPSIGDNEGLNGLDYRSSGDPRSLSTALPGTDPFGNTMYFPDKYPLEGSVTLTLADGIEARLIAAEAALQANANDGQWLADLNHLRQTAIVPALPDLADPGQDASGTDKPRVNLVFRERAFWLFLTGHRHGDLRRLIRNYDGYGQATLYPKGVYQGSNGRYGNEFVVPVPKDEQALNPKYTGCIDLKA